MGIPQIILLVIQAMQFGRMVQTGKSEDSTTTLVGITLLQLLLWWGGWYE